MAFAFEDTARPSAAEARRGSRTLSAFAKALIDTAKTGRAVRVGVNGTERRLVQAKVNAYQASMKRHGFKLITRTANGDNAVLAWVEPLATAEETSRLDP